MVYATQSDMVTKYGEQQMIQLTDRDDVGSTEINEAVLAAELEEATAIINGYVAKRYRVPVSPVPTVLANACKVIAYFSLHRGRHSEQTRQSYEDVLRTLASISNGSFVLDIAGEEPKSAKAQVVLDSAPRQFDKRNGAW